MCSVWKMHGAGNDFLVISHDGSAMDTQSVRAMCDRKRGIGADGVIFLTPLSDAPAHIRMDFYNCDGSRAEMCGNGLRCAARFAMFFMNVPSQMLIQTDVGILGAHVLENSNVAIEMKLLEPIKKYQIEGRSVYFCNTGVPHCVIPLLALNELQSLDIQHASLPFRYAREFSQGANVDWVYQDTSNVWHIRTFERGVEAETEACGTGITAAAVFAHAVTPHIPSYSFLTPHKDELTVTFAPEKITLSGPAVFIAEVRFETLQNGV